ncbi:MAG: hypothetical protein AAFN09_08305 [Pseudomonadota bacterium]
MKRKHYFGAILLALALAPGTPATAQEPGEVAWPDYPTCLANAMARFETDLARAEGAGEGPDYDLLTRYDVQHCGILAIVACDLSNDRVACQDALSAEQHALRQEVIAALPESLTQADPFASALYPQLFQLSSDQSAGPDCAGTEETMRAWCATSLASNDLAVAVLAHKLARLSGASAPAVELGWVGPGAPSPPTQRPAR